MSAIKTPCTKRQVFKEFDNYEILNADGGIVCGGCTETEAQQICDALNNADKHELQVTRLALDTALNIQKDLQQEVERLREFKGDIVKKTNQWQESMLSDNHWYDSHSFAQDIFGLLLQTKEQNNESK